MTTDFCYDRLTLNEAPVTLLFLGERAFVIPLDGFYSGRDLLKDEIVGWNLDYYTELYVNFGSVVLWNDEDGNGPYRLKPEDGLEPFDLTCEKYPVTKERFFEIRNEWDLWGEMVDEDKLAELMGTREEYMCEDPVPAWDN